MRVGNVASARKCIFCGSVLFVFNVSPEGSATEEAGRASTLRIHRHVVVVPDPPEIEVERSWVHSGEGYEAQLVCIVHGEPAPEVRTANLSTAYLLCSSPIRCDGRRKIQKVCGVTYRKTGPWVQWHQSLVGLDHCVVNHWRESIQLITKSSLYYSWKFCHFRKKISGSLVKNQNKKPLTCLFFNLFHGQKQKNGSTDFYKRLYSYFYFRKPESLIKGWGFCTTVQTFWNYWPTDNWTVFGWIELSLGKTNRTS